jgi:deoxyribonuclease (pyrimidine dimer)
MTRINSAIPVKHLADEHLIAECREILRIPWYLHKAIKSGSIKKIPSVFTLGQGHVLFFLDKIKFCKERYKDILEEATNRGIQVKDLSEVFDDVPEEYFNDYVPTSEENVLLVERISERIKNSKKHQWHYYKNSITPSEAISLL